MKQKKKNAAMFKWSAPLCFKYNGAGCSSLLQYLDKKSIRKHAISSLWKTTHGNWTFQAESSNDPVNMSHVFHWPKKINLRVQSCMPVNTKLLPCQHRGVTDTPTVCHWARPKAGRHSTIHSALAGSTKPASSSTMDTRLRAYENNNTRGGLWTFAG